MSRSKKTHAIIPAKSKSTRFPGKNMALLNGIPLYLRAVRYAKERELIPILFTDSEEIKTGGESEGAIIYPQTPDQFEGYEALIPAIKELGIERMVILQATCPFHAPGMLEEMERKMDETGARSIYTCEEVKVNGHLRGRYEKAIQMGENCLHRHDGNLILCTSDFFLTHGNYFLGQESLYLPNYFPYTWDIDYEEELIFAEHLIQLYGWEERQKEEGRRLLFEWDDKGCPYRYVERKELFMPLEYKRGYTILYTRKREGKKFTVESITGMEYEIQEVDGIWMAVKVRDRTREEVEEVFNVEVSHPKWRRVLSLNLTRKRGEVNGTAEGFNILEFEDRKVLKVKWDHWGEETFLYFNGRYEKKEGEV